MVDEELSPEAAIAEIGRAGQKARTASLWTGWIWLAIAASVFVFFLGTGSGNATFEAIAGPVPLVAVPVLYVLAARQRVVSQVAARIERPLANAFSATVVAGILLHNFVLPKGLNPWLTLVDLAIVLPALVGAWRILRA